MRCSWVSEINAALRGHYAYYGVAGTIPLLKVYRVVERNWFRMLRSWAGKGLVWDDFSQIKQWTPLPSANDCGLVRMFIITSRVWLCDYSKCSTHC
jgi:hypothetical protein